ncbi:MAG TPA: hypothetical protein VNJ47_13105 [Nevskiales bacterium]|nr:hypothetical protein [Nevskiales bacterium]
MRYPILSSKPHQDRALPLLAETLLSALASCAVVLVLALLLSLESWVVTTAG